jgi:hypothetical protein
MANVGRSVAVGNRGSDVDTVGHGTRKDSALVGGTRLAASPDPQLVHQIRMKRSQAGAGSNWS